MSFAPAWLACRLVENPIRRNDRLTGHRALVVAVTCVVVAAVTCAALERVVIPGRSAETVAFHAALNQQASDGSHGCASGRSIGQQPPSCTWHVPGSKGTIVLVGTRRGCGFSEVVVGRKNPQSPCLRYVRQSIRDLVARKPALVIMASSVPELVESNAAFRDPDSGQIGRSLNTKAKMWGAGVRKAVLPLVGTAVPAVVVHTIAQFQDWQRNCAAIRAYLDPKSAVSSSGLEQVTTPRDVSTTG